MIKKKVIQLLLPLIIVSSISANNNAFTADSIRAVNTYSSGMKFFKNSNYKAAIDSFLTSAQIREKIYSKESYEFGVVQNALGITYRNIGSLDKALEYFLNAESTYLRSLGENSLSIARLYNNIGNVYFSKLNFETASDYYKKALDIFENQDEIDLPGIADIYYSLANTNFKLKNYYDALYIVDKYSSQAYPDTKLYFLSLKAAIYQELEIYDKAYKSYKDAIDYAKDFYSENNLNLAYEYVNFSDFLIKNNQPKEAENVLSLAKNILNQNKINEGPAFSGYLRTRGFFYENLNVETTNITDFRSRKAGNLTTAIDYYLKGIEALGTDPDRLSDAVYSIENTYSLTQSLELLNLIANAYTQIFDIYSNTPHPQKKEAIEKALDYYEITANIIQQARKQLYSDESKIQLSEMEGATFAKIVQTAYKATAIESDPRIIEFAFSSAERMKASSVFDRLSDQLARENSLVPDSLTELERSLNYMITSQNEKLFNLRRSGHPDHSEISAADSMLFQLKKQRDELIQYLENHYKDYYELKYADAAISSRTVHQNLGENEALIEYVLNESDSVPELYAFLFTAGNLSFHKIDIDSSFIRSIEETFRFMSNPAYLFTRNESSRKFCVDSYNLYLKLIHPFAAVIQNKKITIIPDGKISYLPFDALLTAMPDTSGWVQFNELPYFIKKNAVNYAYSANLLFKFNKTQRKAKKRLLAFAPRYNSDTVVFENKKLILAPLPGVQREVDLIAENIRINLYRNENATEKNFREQSNDYDILHLAMHAFINDSLPAFSRFAFSQNKTNQPLNDGWLNTADVYNLDLNARLTVLSACNTGTGNLRKGEGVMSLARGFLYAGCPTIVMTLWEVEDNAGTQIMSSFYQNLKKGRPTDEALRLAKLDYLEHANPRMAHPHYWLGYVSIGNAQPLFRSYDFYFFGLLVLALAGIAVDQFIRFKRVRKK
jgi:CHAT domain-containing protein/tetratricopeptide (TPR) repeat protein